jgi:pimeloyl-ACP methyl ester carboxylesterase
VQRRIEVSGSHVTINYVDTQGPDAALPVVLVHGLGGRWQHWARVIPTIGARRRVLALDRPGFGGSSPLSKGALDLPMLADVVAALTRVLSLKRVIFVGHSFGGLLGVTFATRHRELTERLVMVGGTLQSFQRTLGGSLLPWFTRPRTALATVAELGYTALPVPEFLRGPIARSRFLRRLALWPFVHAAQRLSAEDARLLIDGAGSRGVVPAARAISRARGWERVAVDVPVSLINADHDRIAPLADLRTYAGRVDKALVVKDSGHLPMIERPEAFLAAFSDAVA